MYGREARVAPRSQLGHGYSVTGGWDWGGRGEGRGRWIWNVFWICRIGHELNWRRGRGDRRCLPGFWCLVMPWIWLITLVTTRWGLVEKEQIFKAGKNLEFYFENVKCEVLAEHPCGEKWQLGRGIWVWRSGEWPGLRLKRLRTVYKAAGMDEVTHWVREHRGERDMRQLWGLTYRSRVKEGNLANNAEKELLVKQQAVWDSGRCGAAAAGGTDSEGRHQEGASNWPTRACPFPGRVLSHLLLDHF